MRRMLKKLNQTLSNFQTIDDRILESTRYGWTDECLDKIILQFDTVLLILGANIEDDSISIEIVESDNLANFRTVEVSNLEPWITYIGKPFGWGWITINQQNYCDGALLSFAGIQPTLLFNVIASSIAVSIVTQLPEKTLFGN